MNTFEITYNATIILACPNIKGLISVNYYHETKYEIEKSLKEICEKLSVLNYDIVKMDETDVLNAHFEIPVYPITKKLERKE